jgi:hypothetical protein
MNKILEKLSLCLSSKLTEIINTHEILNRENIDPQERVKDLEFPENILWANAIIKAEN